MRRLWIILQRLWAWLAQGPRNTQPELRRVEEYVDLLRRHAGMRATTLRLVGRRATEDGVLFERDHFETEDDDGNAFQADVYDTRICSFGHLLLDPQVRPLGFCQICDRCVCSSDGCAAWCCVCGAVCCSIHRATYRPHDDRTVTYCIRCRWRHWSRKFWGCNE